MNTGIRTQSACLRVKSKKIIIKKGMQIHSVSHFLYATLGQFGVAGITFDSQTWLRFASKEFHCFPRHANSFPLLKNMQKSITFRASLSISIISQVELCFSVVFENAFFLKSHLDRENNKLYLLKYFFFRFTQCKQQSGFCFSWASAYRRGYLRRGIHF